MKCFVVLAGALIALTSCAATRSLDERSLGVGGILIEDSVASVTAKLGAPEKRSEHGDYITLRYVYPHLTVGFDDTTVAELTSTSPSACTLQGLCPGDPTSKMIKLYGQPVEAARESGRFYEYYDEQGYSCWYQFVSGGRHISSVGIICQP